MTRNHALLRELGVSSPELDNLVDRACAAGARGAKLSGGGRGGNMLALVDEATAAPVREALLAAGARRVIGTQVG
jgi:mevalonate kinase